MKDLTCTYCTKPFTAQRLRECCGSSCAAKLSQTRRGLTLWEPEAEMWQANTPYATIRRDACVRLAQRIAANPENYTVADLADAHAVLCLASRSLID